MISQTSHSSEGNAGDRFSVMLAHFAFREPVSQRPRSILCRVLDGRDLEEVCPSDAAILSQEERLHYRSLLKNPKAYALAMRTRAELRRMLSRETGLAPHQVPIKCDAHGKPHCLHPAAQDLDFSVTHTDECAIIAIGEAAGVGVDVEQVIQEEPSDENLEIVFNEEEYAAWCALPTTEMRRNAFTQSWTIKEAALKASGMGLDGDTHELAVRFDSAGRAWPVLPSPLWIFERIHFCPRYAASFIAILPKAEAPPRHLLAAA